MPTVRITKTYEYLSPWGEDQSESYNLSMERLCDMDRRLGIVGYPQSFLNKRSALVDKLRRINAQVERQGQIFTDEKYYYAGTPSVHANILRLRFAERLMREQQKTLLAERYRLEAEILELVIRELPTDQGFMDFAIFNEWRVISKIWACDATASTAVVLSKDPEMKPILEHRFGFFSGLDKQEDVDELYTVAQSSDPWVWVKYQILRSIFKIETRLYGEWRDFEVENHREMRNEVLHLIEDFSYGNSTFDPVIVSEKYKDLTIYW